MIGNRAPGMRVEVCIYCGHAECDCDLWNMFSDLYKDENGFRPHWELAHWTKAQVRAWIADRDRRHSFQSPVESW